MAWMRVIEKCVKGVLIAYVIVVLYFQHYMGLADNGDYARSLTPFSTGPFDTGAERPPPGTEAWTMRYGSYWIPYWEYQPSWNRLRSSSALLWIPGVCLNYLFFSPRVLYLPALSLLPKALILVLLLLLFRWIEKSQTQYRLLFYLTLGAPFALVISCQDYLAYLNTFYQESASFIFSLILIASIVLLKRNNQSLGLFMLSLLAVFLLAGAKCSTFYIPFLAVPILFYCRFYGETLRRIFLHYIRMGILLTAGIVILAIYFTYQPEMLKYNQFNSLFYGVLTFSEKPENRLTELGLDESSALVGRSAYTPDGAQFIHGNWDNMSHLNLLLVLRKEPAIVLKAMAHAAANMQDITLDYLGKYARDDPRSKIAGPILPFCEVRSESPPAWTAYNLWAVLKYRFFPLGYMLFIMCSVYIIFFSIGLHQRDFCWELSIIGLFATAACVVDMFVAIIGDGRSELIKHLFLANLLFDIATIAWLNVLILTALYNNFAFFSKYSGLSRH